MLHIPNVGMIRKIWPNKQKQSIMGALAKKPRLINMDTPIDGVTAIYM